MQPSTTTGGKLRVISQRWL